MNAAPQPPAEWSDWLAARTDALLSLDERITGAGDDIDRADVAAAFVARKAIAARLDAIAAAPPAAVPELAAAAVRDDAGTVVGENLADAARLLELVIDRVERRVAAREADQTRDARRREEAGRDLAVAERLSAELGQQANAVASLGKRVLAGTAPADTASSLAALRADLEAAAAERDGLLAGWAVVRDRLAELRVDEARTRAVVAECTAKIVAPPRLAVPSIDVLVAEVDAVPDLDSLPWPAARGHIAPLLARVDRAGAALREVHSRFEAPLQRRDELRGVLLAFARKASSRGLGESAAVEPLYRSAKDELWTAPCDVDAAAALVSRYIEAVNSHQEVGR